VRTDKGFKEVHVNKVAKALQEFTSEHLTGTQVDNHLRKWRQRWARVCKLRDLSGELWDALTCSISLDQEHYLGHCKVMKQCPLVSSLYPLVVVLTQLLCLCFFGVAGPSKRCRATEQAYTTL
jgi:hypothetical protein